MSGDAHAYLAYVVDTVNIPVDITRYDPETGAPSTLRVQRQILPGTDLDANYRNFPEPLMGFGYRVFEVAPTQYSAGNQRLAGKAWVGDGFSSGPVTMDEMRAKQAEIDAIFDKLGVSSEGRYWRVIAEMS